MTIDLAASTTTTQERRERDKIRVLMELRPCFDGYAGIPQETRLLFAAFARAPDLVSGGLLNGANSIGQPGGRKPRLPSKAAELFAQAGSLIALDTSTPALSLVRRVMNNAMPQVVARRLDLLQKWGHVEDLRATLDPEQFGDWLWMRLFRLGLPPRDRALLQKGEFAIPGTSWGDAARLATFHERSRVVLDMEGSGWDVHVAHTPSPYRLRGGKMLVRYHDAIPILWPHTISHAFNHAKSHYAMLRNNVAEGAWFVCTSDPVRDDLLSMFPQAEKRTITIPTMSSSGFTPSPKAPEEVRSIINRGRNAAAEKMRDMAIVEGDNAPGEKKGGDVTVADEPFFIAVSTLEPRKNYALLMRAAASARRAGARFRLVIVANPGWRSDQEVALLKQLVSEGIVYHLVDLSATELRTLYSASHAVICPSRAEGFDLATVEGMACGAPVLASDIPVHRWVCGDAAGYFDPYNEDALAELLRETAALPRREGYLAELAAKGTKRAGLFHPDVLEPKWHEALQAVVRS